VTDAFFAALDRAVARYRPFVDALPRLRGAVEPGDEITVRAIHTQPAPGEIVCRFRAHSDTEDRFYELGFSTDGETFRQAGTGFPNRTYWYQLGWRVTAASQVVWEPWVEVRQ
jgi:hypothetical protein